MSAFFRNLKSQLEILNPLIGVVRYLVMSICKIPGDEEQIIGTYYFSFSINMDFKCVLLFIESILIIF